MLEWDNMGSQLTLEVVNCFNTFRSSSGCLFVAIQFYLLNYAIMIEFIGLNNAWLPHFYDMKYIPIETR